MIDGRRKVKGSSKPKPQPLFVLRGNTESVSCSQWNVDGSVLCSGALDGSLMVWDYATKRCLLKFQGRDGDHHNGINSVSWDAFHPAHVWSQSRDGWIRLWNVETQQCISGHDVGTHGFVGMSVTYWDGQTFAALPDPADMKSVIGLSLDARAKHVQVLHQWNSPDADGMCMKLDSCVRNGRWEIYCGYEAGRLVRYSRDEDRVSFDLPASVEKFPMTAVRVDPVHNMGCCAGAEQIVLPFRLMDDQVVFDEQICHTLPYKGVNDIAFRHDGKVLATAGWDGKVRLFATKPGRERLVCLCEFHSEAVNCLAFRPQSNIFVAASKDTKISIWDVLSS